MSALLLASASRSSGDVRSDTLVAGEFKLTASDATVGDLFGTSVSVSGDTALIGARLDDGAGFLSPAPPTCSLRDDTPAD